MFKVLLWFVPTDEDKPTTKITAPSTSTKTPSRDTIIKPGDPDGLVQDVAKPAKPTRSPQSIKASREIFKSGQPQNPNSSACDIL